MPPKEIFCVQSVDIVVKMTCVESKRHLADSAFSSFALFSLQSHLLLHPQILDNLQRLEIILKIHKCHNMNHKSSNLSPDHISFWNPSVLKPLLFLSDQLTRDGTHSERISKRPANNQVQFYDFLCICMIVLFLAIISRSILCFFCPVFCNYLAYNP